MKRALWAALAALFFCLTAHAQWTTVTAANIQNTTGAKLARGRLCFRPVDTAGHPISFVGAGGQTVSAPACFEVTNGAIPAGSHVLDTAQTTPAHVCYALTIRDHATGKLVLGGDASAGYDCAQPTGATWSLDSYQPNLAPTATASNVSSLERGGTGNNLWLPARCVRVSNDGVKLEAAPADCSAGGGPNGTFGVNGGGVANPNLKDSTDVHFTALGSDVTAAIQALPISRITGLQTALDSKANDSVVLHNSGDETATGRKSFQNLSGIRFADQYCDTPGTLDQSCVTNAVASNTEVYVPAGTYSIASPMSVNAKSNVKLTFDKGAVLQGAAGLGGTSPLLQIYGASSKITVTGGQWNGNSYAKRCIWIPDASHVTIQDTECYGSVYGGIGTAYGAAAAFSQKDIRYLRNYIHNVTGYHALMTGYVDGCLIDSNRVENSPSGYTGINFGVSDHCTVVNNDVEMTDAATNSNGIYSFGVSNFVVSNNRVKGARFAGSTAGRLIYADSGQYGVISNNLVDGQSSYVAGVYCEVCRAVTISGNTVTDIYNYGIMVNGRDDEATAPVNVLDALTDLTFPANVTGSVDESTKQEGTGALKLAVADAFTTGTLFYQNFATAQDLTTGWDGNGRNAPMFWIRTDWGVGSNQLRLQMSTTDALGNVVIDLPLPPIAANTWTRLKLDFAKFYPTLIGIKSWGLVANTALPVINIWLDDFRMGTTGDDIHITGNTVLRAGLYGIYAGSALQDSTITNNLVKDTGWYVSTNSAFAIRLYSNNAFTVKNITIANNILRNTTGIVQWSYPILLAQQDTSTMDSIRVLNNDIGDAFNQAALTTSGTVTHLSTRVQNAVLDTDTVSGKGIFDGGVSTGTLATGTAPYQTSSTTVNTNLNADLLDSQHASDIIPTTISCSGTDKLRAYDSATHSFTCDTDQGGAGSGDNISVNGSAATDANFGNLPAAEANYLLCKWQVDTSTSPDNVSLECPYGTTGSSFALGNDARFSDARTPTAHASAHVTGGGDVIATAVASGNAGLMSGADKAKLDGIAAGATANSSADWPNAGSCPANQYQTADTNGAGPTCAQVAYSQVSGTPTLYNQTIQDEGAPLTQRSAINFAGAGVSCADDTTKTTCTISGSAGLYTAANDGPAAAGNKATSGTCTWKVNTSDRWYSDCTVQVGGPEGPSGWVAISDPGSPADGDDWYSSTTANRRKFRAGATTQVYAWQSEIPGVDDSTIELNVGNLRVKDAGITLAKLTAAALRRPIAVIIKGSGTDGVLQDADDVLSAWNNGFGTTWKVSAISACRDGAGGTNPTVMISKANSGADLLTGAITVSGTCSADSYTAGTLVADSGANRTVSDGGGIDVKIVAAGGTATEVHIKLVGSLQ